MSSERIDSDPELETIFSWTSSDLEDEVMEGARSDTRDVERRVTITNPLEVEHPDRLEPNLGMLPELFLGQKVILN